MKDVALICHFYPTVKWQALTLRQFVGLLHRIPDIVGTGSAKPEAGDLLELEYVRGRDGI